MDREIDSLLRTLPFFQEEVNTIPFLQQTNKQTNERIHYSLTPHFDLFNYSFTKSLTTYITLNIGVATIHIQRQNRLLVSVVIVLLADLLLVLCQRSQLILRELQGLFQRHLHNHSRLLLEQNEKSYTQLHVALVLGRNARLNKQQGSEVEEILGLLRSFLHWRRSAMHYFLLNQQLQNVDLLLHLCDI